jgi:hypothetical protein
VFPAEHPYIKFWWKVDVPAVTRGLNPDISILGYREDYRAGDLKTNGAVPWRLPFAPTTTAAKVETSAKGRYGSLTVDGYFTPGTKLTRRIVQLDDGTLVVHDTLLPDADADGRNAGPVWHLDSDGAPTLVAPGVYDATGFYNTKLRSRSTARLLVVMEQSPGRSFGSERPLSPLWADVNPYATYARQTLKKNVPVSVVTVLMPNDGSTAAATLASRIRIQRDNCGAVIVQTPAAKITFASGDTWKVE